MMAPPPTQGEGQDPNKKEEGVSKMSSEANEAFKAAVDTTANTDNVVSMNGVKESEQPQN